MTIAQHPYGMTALLKSFFKDLGAFFVIITPRAHLLIIAEATADFSSTIRIEFLVTTMFEPIFQVYFKPNVSVCIFFTERFSIQIGWVDGCQIKNSIGDLR